MTPTCNKDIYVSTELFVHVQHNFNSLNTCKSATDIYTVDKPLQCDCDFENAIKH